MTQPKPLIAGNWKMNGLRADLAEIAAMAERVGASRDVAVAICPPFTLIAEAAQVLAGGTIALGAQDCSALAHGAHTGDVSATMLRDAGCRFVILGHSERRQSHGEADALIQAKARAAQAADLAPIVCVGESLAQREAGLAARVVREQALASAPAAGSLAIAYEPVWAIGSGLTPSDEEIVAAHGAIREALAEMRGSEAAAGVRILYGGSVKPANAAHILSLPGVNGALVGGASLKAGDFCAIVDGHPARRR